MISLSVWAALAAAVAAALRAAGFNAYLLNDSGFPVWIDDPFVRTHARVIASSHCPIRGHDALVISESVNDAILNTIKDWQATKVLFAQNAVGLRPSDRRRQPWEVAHFAAHITPSQFVAGVMREEFNWSDVALIPPALSEDMFYPSDRLGQSVIACSGRKWPQVLTDVKAKVAADKTMTERFQWIDLENRAESFIAATLRRAAMAVCIGAHEGFGLPPWRRWPAAPFPAAFPAMTGRLSSSPMTTAFGPRPLTPTKSSKACNAPPRVSPNRPAANRCARPDKRRWRAIGRRR